MFCFYLKTIQAVKIKFGCILENSMLKPPTMFLLLFGDNLHELHNYEHLLSSKLKKHQKHEGKGPSFHVRSD